jgi:hypothetical protein
MESGIFEHACDGIEREGVTIEYRLEHDDWYLYEADRDCTLWIAVCPFCGERLPLKKDGLKGTDVEEGLDVPTG